jgi:gliding motility-associated-like protein
VFYKPSTGHFVIFTVLSLVPKYILTLWAVLLTFLVANAQDRFATVGNARAINADCFLLTEDKNNDFGAVWYQNRVSLTQPFEISFKAFFGCRDNGADGITFTLQQKNVNVGGLGGGIGVAGVKPSFSIEFDTYQNPSYGDSVEDHVGIMLNGNPNHAKGWMYPIPIGDSGNIEDCKEHHVNIKWEPSTTSIYLSFDCRRIFWAVIDITNEVFNGNPNVYWGFTSATGGRSAEHRVCITYTDIIKYLPDREICKGKSVQLSAGLGTNVLWTPSYGLSDSAIRNPIASPETTTTYVVKKKDDCDLEHTDTLTVKVNHISGFLDEFKDTVFCKGEQIKLFSNENYATYLWNTGEDYAEIEIDSLGTFWLQITDSIGCKGSDTIEVKSFVPLPSSGLPKTISYWSNSCEDSAIQLIPQVGNTYTWSTAETSPTIIAEQEGMYWVEVDNNVCTTIDTIVIDKFCPPRIYVPNAFTPNGDGINDGWFVVCEECTAIEVNIYNRWGERVFSANNLDFIWNGEHKNYPCQEGVYTYTLTYSGYREGETFTDINTQGNISLLR